MGIHRRRGALPVLLEAHYAIGMCRHGCALPVLPGTWHDRDITSRLPARHAAVGTLLTALLQHPEPMLMNTHPDHRPQLGHHRTEPRSLCGFRRRHQPRLPGIPVIQPRPRITTRNPGPLIQLRLGPLVPLIPVRQRRLAVRKRVHLRLHRRDTPRQLLQFRLPNVIPRPLLRLLQLCLLSLQILQPRPPGRPQPPGTEPKSHLSQQKHGSFKQQSSPRHSNSRRRRFRRICSRVNGELQHVFILTSQSA